MLPRLLIVRWSIRDLRRRWPQVAAIAAIIAIGTGVFASLSGTAVWRRQSNDASYARGAFHDIHVALSPGTNTAQGTLLQAIGSIPHAAMVDAVQERLVVATVVDASFGGKSILVPGRLVGSSGQTVDRTLDRRGVAIEPSSAAEPTALIETGFARAWSMPAAGTVRISGDQPVTYSAPAFQPEYFYPTGDQSSAFASPGSFAVLFTSLADAQRVSGQSGMVNDLVLRLRPGADRALVVKEVQTAVATSTAAISAEVTTRDDNPAYRLLYKDIDGDQRTWTVISFLVLGGAALAVFNLVSRIVESERREIGVGMALGTPRRYLAARPLLVGLQVALLGVALGVGVGRAMDAALASVFKSALPLPVWRTPFQAWSFARAAMVGVAMPVMATIWPTLRAVRMEPVTAIRTGPRSVGGNGRGRWLIPGLGRTYRTLPFRNVVRNARRTMLTATAVGAAVAVLVAVLGLLDAFGATVDRALSELEKTHPDRVEIQLESFQPATSASISDVRSMPTVGASEGGLRVPIHIGSAESGFDAVGEVFAMRGGLWAPSVASGRLPQAANEVLLGGSAARDLNISIGGHVEVTHPQRVGLGYRLATTDMTVVGTTGFPLRTFAFFDTDTAATMNLAGIVNVLRLDPATGSSPDDVIRAAFARSDVASARATSSWRATFDDALDTFTTVLRVTSAAVLCLALLIAFNSSSISVDERTREHATMFAFGLPRRSVVTMLMVEGAITGLLGTVIGIVGGYWAMQWIIHSSVSQTMPDITVITGLSVTSVFIGIAVGVAAVAIAPIFTVRRLRSMDIPDALRTVE